MRRNARAAGNRREIYCSARKIPLMEQSLLDKFRVSIY
jgi:hypothetical protein